MKAIIFDLNGVFVVSPNLSDRFTAEFNVPLEDFLTALKDVLKYARQSKTGASFKYWQPYLKQWGLDLNEKQFFDFWFKAEKINPEIVALAQDMKNRGFQIFILSNNFKERAEYYTEQFPEMEKVVDKIYYSWLTGFVKPDKRAFENILMENNLSAEDCIYFDNSQENIDVATALGIKAYLFTDSLAARKIIDGSQRNN